MSRALRTTAVVFLAALALACGGLPDALREQAARQEAALVKIEADVAERERAYAELRGSGDWELLARYAERESWSGHFDEARRELTRARTLRNDGVEPLLAEDRGEDADALRAALARVTEVAKGAVSEAAVPARRAGRLLEVARDAPAMLETATRDVAGLGPVLERLGETVARAAADYAGKAEDLSGREAGVRKRAAEAEQALGQASAELAKDADRDLAVLGDSVAASRADAAAAREAAVAVETRAGELYRSYSKTLADMREDYSASVGRTSWNEAYDFPTEHTSNYPPVDVDDDTLDALEAWGDRPLAVLRAGLFGSDLQVQTDPEVWAALRVDPLQQLPRGDNAAEYWVRDTGAQYFHRYETREGSETQTGDWVAVPTEVYERHRADLGLELVAKPYGAYEDEALEQATPPGLAYVGNPAYGKWEQDGEGRRRWSWFESYLFYSLVFGGRRHHWYHSDWDRWNRGYRGRRPYYGADPSRPTYGTWGDTTRQSGRYAGTTVARRGGLRRQDASVRGAGASGRGGGPGGRGK